MQITLNKNKTVQFITFLRIIFLLKSLFQQPEFSFAQAFANQCIPMCFLQKNVRDYTGSLTTSNRIEKGGLRGNWDAYDWNTSGNFSDSFE